MMHVEMLTFGPYQPLAGMGTNTFRRYSDKYANLRPGDMVKMTYVDESAVKDGVVVGTAHGEEYLRVRSVVIAPYVTVERHHNIANHGKVTDGELRQLFERVYPDFDLHDPFMAIYFD